MIKEQVHEAYEFAKRKHEGQVRKFSELPYFTHPKYVARVIEQLTKDEDLVAAALLHDVLEDTDATYEELHREFGKTVASLVQELTNDKSVKGKDKAIYLSSKMAAMTSGALTIKLADRFHNVLFLESDDVSVSFKKKYWNETRIIMSSLRKVRGSELDEVQEVLADRIDVILRFLQIRYEWF